jgi:hypothetical protein
VTDKSVLEKYYDDEAKKRRLPTPEEQAIEPVYPEELLIGGVAGKLFKSVASKLKDKAEVFMRPKVKNSLYPDIPDGTLSGKYAVRNVISPEEIKSIKESGYMLPKKGGKQQKYFVQTDNMPSSVPFDSPVSSIAHIRVPIDKVPANRAVSRKDVETYNRDSGKFEPLKKGGKVSSVSKRADGIAQRGKTKGRMV